jgi:hypothetical protein
MFFKSHYPGRDAMATLSKGIEKAQTIPLKSRSGKALVQFRKGMNKVGEVSLTPQSVFCPASILIRIDLRIGSSNQRKP